MTSVDKNKSKINSNNSMFKEIVDKDDLTCFDASFQEYLQHHTIDYSVDNETFTNNIQRLYSKQKHCALKIILYGGNVCSIDLLIIEKHFALILSSRSKCDIANLRSCLWKEINMSESHNILLTMDFTQKEIRTKLKAIIYNQYYGRKSTGIDNISYHRLHKLDRNCCRLKHLFNGCLKLQVVPESWKQSYSLLMQKNKKIDRIENWRLITLHNHVFQLFQKLLNDRLTAWGKNTGLLSKSQKHFYSSNAVYENCFLLQECKKYAKANGKDLVVAWLDFSNASESIPQQAIHYLLNKYPVPESISNIIQNILRCETKIKILNHYTKNIEFLKALPRGFSINNILISFLIEPILQDLANNNHNAFRIFDDKINHFVIYDELTLIAESAKQLKRLINLVERNAKLIGLKFKHKRCSTLHYIGQTNKVKGTQFLLLSDKLKALRKNKIDEHFGVRFGLSIVQKGIPTIQEMLHTLKKIDASPLTNNQKIESFQLFISSRFKSYLQGLESIDQSRIQEIDNKVIQKLSSWLNIDLTQQTIEQVLHKLYRLKSKYMNRYLPFIDVFYILKIVNAYSVLNSSDKVINNIAYHSIATEVFGSKFEIPLCDQMMKNLSCYLSGNLSIKNTQDNNTTWQMARQAILKLKPKLNLKWQFKNDRMKLILTENGQHLIIDGNSSLNIQKVLESKLKQIITSDKI